MKKYFDVKGREEKIKVYVSYELGGINYFSGNTNRRGYYVYIQPVKIEDRGSYKSESFMMFDGFKQLLKEVARKSSKAESESIAMAEVQALDLAKRMAESKGWELDI